MATFQQWLNEQQGRPQTDPVGWLARYWESKRDTRPRRSSPDSIERWLSDDAPDDATRHAIATAMGEAKLAYRGRDKPAPGETPRELTQAEREAFTAMNEPDPTGTPDAPASAPGTGTGHEPQGKAREIAEAYGWIPGQPELTGDSHADLDAAYRAATGQEPPPPPPGASAQLAVLEQLTRDLLQASHDADERAGKAVELAALTLRMVTRIARQVGVTDGQLDTEMSLASQLAGTAPAPDGPVDMSQALYGEAMAPDPTPPDQQAQQFAAWWGQLPS